MRILASCILVAALCLPVHAQQFDDPGAQPAEDLYESAQGGKYANTDSTAPWNAPLMENDPFAPWNDTFLENDSAAPWNNPMSRPQDANAYLRDKDVSNQDYYWK